MIRSGDVPVVPLALAVTIAAVAVDALTLAPGASLVREHGAIEMASALLYLLVALVWWGQRGSAALRTDWEIPVLLLAMMAREFDLDKALTSVGLFKSSLYLRAGAPLWERLLGAAVIGVLAVAVTRLVLRHGRAMLGGLRRFEAGPLAVLAAVGFVGASKTIDGLARKLRPLGIEVTEAVSAGFEVAEEVMELFVPIMLLLAVRAGAAAGNRVMGGLERKPT